MKLLVMLAVLMTLVSAAGSVADDPAPLRAAVQILSSESNSGADSGMPTAGAPRGALPQYRDQLYSRQQADAPDKHDAPIRFLVPLPERPVLIEAHVTVDGRPYRTLRELRVDRLLAGLAAAERLGKSEEAHESRRETPPIGEEPAVKSETPAPVDNSMDARLSRYARSTGRLPTRDEVHWLLANWGDGPVVLVLGENFQRVRAGQAPVVTVLDRDGDGVISAVELVGAQKTLLRLDSDRNGVVSYEEIFEAADGLLRAGRTQAAAQPAPLVPIADLLRSQTYRWLAGRYQSNATSGKAPAVRRLDANDDGKLDQMEFSQLRDSDPDLRLAVSFNTQDAGQSTVESEIVGSHIAPGAPATLRGSAITIQTAGALLELSAVQSPNAGQSDQISIGAINDGYPLLPEIDPIEDGKLTIRELRDVSGLLATFDRDRDGSLSTDEILPTVRVSIGHGPTVHQHLATLRSVHQLPTQPGVKPPDWFARMDKNQDNDLTRSEFLGTDEQFNQLDGDRDKLIDVAEAALNQGAALTSPRQSTSDNFQSNQQ